MDQPVVKIIAKPKKAALHGDTRAAKKKPPGCAEQRDEIAPLKERLEKGDIWYVVDVRWFKQWKNYVGFDAWDQAQMGADSAHPGPVDTSALFKDRDRDILKDHLMEDLDYSLVPEEVWKKFVVWYGLEVSSQAIPRKVVEHGLYVKHFKVEVYLVEFKLALHPDVDKFQTKKFSREDTVAVLMKVMKEIYSIPEEKECRVWHKYMLSTYDLLSKLDESIQDAGLYTNQLILLEVKNKDGNWPRKATIYTGTNMVSVRSSDVVEAVDSHNTASAFISGECEQSSDPGVCGLSNLGNTCFMNSALQCLSNTYTLTDYFLKDAYRKDINEKNLLGMGGNLAKAYGSLLHEMWTANTSYTHPRNMKATIGKFAPRFTGYAQHDAQELLDFLLNGLHEDLNQVLKKPYVNIDTKSEGREDKDIAQEAWRKHVMCNKSVLMKLFQGQLKSMIVCPDCRKVSRTFHPFMCMSLPLPIEKTRDLVIHLVRNDPTKQIEKVRITVLKHGIISSLLAEVSKQTRVSKDRMVVIDVYNSRFHKIFGNKESIALIMDRDDIYCYEVRVTSAQDPNFTVIPVYNREKVVRTVNYTYGSSYTSTYHQLFGVPQLVTVPRDGLTYRTFYRILLDHMRRYVKLQTKLKSGKENMLSNAPRDGNNSDCFTMSIVNGCGSQVLRSLVDDDTQLKLNNNTYIACDWDSNWKEECYDLAEAEFKINHPSMSQSATEEKKKNINLLDCVKLFTVEEQFGEEGTWYCPLCKEQKQAFKKVDLWKLPEILVIHLKRFTYNRYWRDKLDVLVDFPVHELNLSNELINPDDPEPIYDLYAVTNHHSGMSGGHYTAYAKNALNGKWYHFDDSHVSETDEHHVVTSAAYMLFYKRRIEGQPLLRTRNMSSYKHTEPSKDTPDHKKMTPVTTDSSSKDHSTSCIDSESKRSEKGVVNQATSTSVSKKPSQTMVSKHHETMVHNDGKAEHSRGQQKQKTETSEVHTETVKQKTDLAPVNNPTKLSHPPSGLKSAASKPLEVPMSHQVTLALDKEEISAQKIERKETSAKKTEIIERFETENKYQAEFEKVSERIQKIENKTSQDLATLQNRLHQKEKQIETLSNEVSQSQKQTTTISQNLAALRQHNEEESAAKHQQIGAINQDLANANQEIVQLKKSLQVKENELTTINKEMKESLKQKEDEMASFNQQIRMLTESVQSKDRELLKRLQTKEEEIAALKDSIQQRETSSVLEITALTERIQAQQIQLQTQETQLQTQETQLQTQEAQQHTQVARLEGQLQTQATQMQTFCNNALQQMRQRIEREMQRRMEQLTNQMTTMQTLFNAVKPQWLVSRREITLTQNKLGDGGWGRVVQATFRDEQVAAKCLHHQIISEYNIRHFVREMQISAKCHHPNLLRFLGATLEGDPIILTELMEKNLHDVIRQHELKDHQFVWLLHDIASAVNYLHCLSPEPIIHRDISSSNVLLRGPVKSKWVAKLSDFGSANFIWHTTMHSEAPGNPAYAAPEVLNPHEHSEKMDVYSFGALLFEVCSGQAPSLQIRNEVLPTAAAVWPEPQCHYVSLIVSCTKRNKNERPSMNEVLAEL